MTMNDRVFKKLPLVHQSETLNKFFRATIDQWFTKDSAVKSLGYVGQKNGGMFNPVQDFYFPEIDLTRQNYQLEPTLTVKETDTASIINTFFYDDVLRQLSIEGSNIFNHDRLFKSKAYSWAPPIDIDKFLNYENYYWYDDGPVKLDVTATTTNPLNVDTDIIGKTSFTSANGVEFTNGLKIEFGGSDITPTSYVNKEYIIEGVGKSIKLIALISNDLDPVLPYTIPAKDSPHMWDYDFWDEVVWDATITKEGTELEDRIDYVTIKRGAINQNPWSRTNRWFHKDVLLRATGMATGKSYTTETPNLWDDEIYDSTPWDATIATFNETFSLNNFRQAKRPIIEFDDNLELYNYGLEGVGHTTVISSKTYDEVHLATDPVVDEHTLVTGDLVIFLNVDLLKFNPWDSTAWDPGSHPTSQQVSPGPYLDMPVGTAGDWDVSLQTGAENLGVIYEVTMTSGVCTLSVNKEVMAGQKVFAKAGEVYLGKEVYWDGSDWNLSQLKTKQNDEPLFQLYDNEKVKVDDNGLYPGSIFVGSPLFSYKESTGVNDTIIGKPLEYKEFGQVADIVFSNNFEDVITYNLTSVVFGYKYCHHYSLDSTATATTIPKDKLISSYNNGWNPTNIFSKQRVVDRFIPEVDGAQDHVLSVLPLTNSPADVVVTVDGIRATQSTTSSPKDYSITDKTLTFSTNKPITANQVIEVKSFTKDLINLNDAAYFEIPNNLEANPDNLDVSEVSASELLEHFKSIVENQQGVIGDAIGTNNYRDTTQDKSLGLRILQHESTLLPLMYLLSNKEIFNVTESIRFGQNEYASFKNRVIQQAETLSLQEPINEISVFVDHILEALYVRRSDLKTFNDTKALGYSTNYVETVYYPEYDVGYIDLDFLLVTTEIINKEKIFYIYRTTPAEREAGKYHTLLIKNVDYTFETHIDNVGNQVTRVVFIQPLLRNEKIEIRIFENIQNAFVPATPSMLGMYSVWVPKFETDNTYVDGSKDFIIGHDGSRTLRYNDYRDDVLLEVEKRIYNAIPDKFTNEYLSHLNHYQFTPGKFRDNDYTADEYNNMLEPIVQRWAKEHDVDLLTHRYFDESLPFTWNYSTQPDRDGKQVPGSWRGIYLHFYDTIRPHSHVWEMLGFTDKPTWWDSEYGATVSTNTHLWSDLENGIIRHGARENYTDGSYLIENPFKRTGLSNFIPVDTSGDLLDPVEAGIFGDPTTFIVGGVYSAPHGTDRENPWVFGDVTPAEYGARIDSVWPFMMSKLAFLCRPAEFSVKNWDTYNVDRSKAQKEQFVFNDTKKRKQIKDLRFHQDTSLDYVYGYQQWLYNLFVSTGRDYKFVMSEIFKTVGISLGYKAGGFISNSFKVIADTYSTTRTSDSIFVPEENKTVRIHDGASEGLRIYSGVIVTVTEFGFSVSGYDTFNGSFYILPSVTTGESTVVEVEGVRVTRYISHYDIVTEVQYGQEFGSLDEIYDFLISYERYLTTVGFVFDSFDYDLNDMLDWSHAGKEFIFWASMTKWDVGSFITLSPSASKIKLDTSAIGRISNVKDVINNTYSILNQNGNLIPFTDLSVSRDENYFTITSVSGIGIYGFKINTFKSEHAIIFDNTTSFNDLIYDPLLRLRQNRLKLNITKTADWIGTVNADGYIVRDDTIVPNFESTANNYRKFFNVYNTATSTAQVDSARHLIGYQKRDYLDNITEDSNVSFDFYKGMLQQKGTSGAIDKLLRSNKLNNDNVSFFEEFAFKVGEFGALGTTTDNEVKVQSGDVRVKNPLIEFTYEDNSVDVVYDDVIQINYNNDDRWFQKPKMAKTNVWPKLSFGHRDTFNWLPTAGYVHDDDVTFKVFDNIGLAALNTSQRYSTEPAKGAMAQIAQWDNNEFAVCKLIETELEVHKAALLETGKTEVSIIDENVPTITGNVTDISVNVGDTVVISLDGAAGQTVTLSSFSSTLENEPLMVVGCSASDNIQKDDSIFINGTEIIFSSVPAGPFTLIGSEIEPTVTSAGSIVIDGTAVNFVVGDTLTAAGVGGVAGGIIANITAAVTNVTATSHNGYLRLVTTGSTITIIDQGNGITGMLGVREGVHHYPITVSEVHTDILAAGVSNLFATKDEIRDEIQLSNTDSTIEVTAGIGRAFTSLFFRNSNSNSVTSIDNRVVAMSDVITDLNAAGLDEDFLATTSIDGYLELVYNGASLGVAGTALSGLGILTQTKTLSTSAVTEHPFSHNDVVVLQDIKTSEGVLMGVDGGYVVEEKTTVINKSIKIINSAITVTDNVTGALTSLTNTNTISLYDIVSADRDFVEKAFVTVKIAISPNEIKMGDPGYVGNATDQATSGSRIFSAFVPYVGQYSTGKIGPYTALIDGNGNISINTVSGGNYTSGEMDVLISIKKKGIFDIDLLVEETGKSTTNILWWHSRRFVTKTDALDSVKGNKAYYELTDYVWVDNDPDGWVVAKLVNKDATTFDNMFTVVRQEEQRINTELFNSAKLYDSEARTIDAKMELIDHAKGIISGLANTEITYKERRDPARYNVTDDVSFLVDEDDLWDSKQAGNLWWDLSTVAFYDAEQGDNRYRRQYWNSLFPGSTVDIYEWVSDIVRPSSYVGTGTVRNVNQYSQIDEWNTETNQFDTKYYFWVKNKTIVPETESRDRSAYDVSRYISDPSGQGVPWYAPVSNHYEWTLEVVIPNTNAKQSFDALVLPTEIVGVTLNGTAISNYTAGTVDADGKISAIVLASLPTIGDVLRISFKRPGGAMVINNVDHLLTESSSTLQLNYNIQKTESNVHKQWILLRNNDSRSKIPTEFIDKMIDSLIGFDKTGLLVPDTALLHEVERYGMKIRPRQSWFVNTKNARKEFIVQLNLILSVLDTIDEKTGWDVDVYTSSMLEYIDWWETGYSADTVVNFTVNTKVDRDALGLGDIVDPVVKVLNAGGNTWRVYKYSTSTGKFTKIGIEKQTVKLKDTLYENDLTSAEGIELRDIIGAIFNNVFTIDWEVYRNQLFFDMVNYVLTEQNDVNWVFKSTYINVTTTESDVKQTEKFKVDLIPNVQEYITEVKPYSTKVREFVGVKQLSLENAGTHITDFDNPPYLDTGGLFGTANSVVPLYANTSPSYDEILATGIYNDYLQNYTDNNLIRSSKVSLVFDRVSAEFSSAKTYSKRFASGSTAFGSDSRIFTTKDEASGAITGTFVYAPSTTVEERQRDSIVDISARSNVGTTDHVTDRAAHRIAKYSSTIGTTLTELAKSALIVDSNISSHPVIIKNDLHTATTISYDQLVGADIYYSIAKGYHEDLLLTVVEAVQRYDLDVNQVYRSSSNVEPGDKSAAQLTINTFINDYNNKQELMNKEIALEFFDKRKLQIEDGSRFDLTKFEEDIPEPQEWGWDSVPWDYHEQQDDKEVAIVTWDEGDRLEKIFAEFPNYSDEKELTNDKIAWHLYDLEEKTGVEKVQYSKKNIYITASGLPDHSYGPFPNTNNTFKVLHQNAYWKIPITVTVPVTVNKESLPFDAPVGLFRNGVTLYNAVSNWSHEGEGVWYHDLVNREPDLYGTDSANGNVNPIGQYYYYHNPKEIYKDESYVHSPLLGYAFDGVPIYGPQSFSNINGTGEIRLMKSSYRLKSGARTAVGTETHIPSGDYNGYYVQDYEYVVGLGDLDEYNGRTCVTPEYPDGVYAYFITVDELGESVYPYVIGPKYYGLPENTNYSVVPGPYQTEELLSDDNGIPNVSTDRQDRDSKGLVRPTWEQWPEEFVPITPKEGLQITVQTNDPNSVGDPISFRIYYDADGETKYYALPDATSTTISSAINKDVVEIPVTNAKLLPMPVTDSYVSGQPVPGVVFIGNERIEYFNIDTTNNRLLNCRRGTGTTSAQSHSSNTKVFSGTENNILTYDTETTWTPDATHGLYASLSDQAIFLKDRLGSALS